MNICTYVYYWIFVWYSYYYMKNMGYYSDWCTCHHSKICYHLLFSYWIKGCVFWVLSLCQSISLSINSLHMIFYFETNTTQMGFSMVLFASYKCSCISLEFLFSNTAWVDQDPPHPPKFNITSLLCNNNLLSFLEIKHVTFWMFNSSKWKI